jgi:multimeric flavodoxin WrbA
MKVLAINSSPRKEKGNTAVILNPFLDGMKETGAEVELFYTGDLKINPCSGDLNCWTRRGGKCGQNDDMKLLDPKIREADVLVLASPLYCDGVTGPMKTLMDRTVPEVRPFIEIRDGHTRHPLQENVKRSKIVLVSNCGFWELDNFDPAVAHIKAYCKNADAEFAGALLRPHGEFLKTMLDMGLPVSDVIDAAREAGRQLAREGRISQDVLNTVSRELLPRDLFVEKANEYFQEMLKGRRA